MKRILIALILVATGLATVAVLADATPNVATMPDAMANMTIDDGIGMAWPWAAMTPRPSTARLERGGRIMPERTRLREEQRRRTLRRTAIGGSRAAPERDASDKAR